MIKRSQITKKQALNSLKITSQIPVKLLSVDIESALKIAMENNIYAYDAYFLQSSLTNNCPLISLDKQMKSVARKLNIELME